MDKLSLQRRIAAATACQVDQGIRKGDARLVPAAVLIPLIEREEGMHILLTRRTDTLRSHPGQISFPGGRIEPSDASIEAAALRESQEEIGLPPNRVEILGRLGCWRIRTGYIIYPVIGMIELPVVLKPDPSEVAEIFEVPLSFLLNPKNHKPHIIEYDGERHEFVAMPYGEYYIWGATAGMLHTLYHTLADETV
ncbi:MAG TPA: CoA pyrophosphatase [Gammaproteobacteria bacterium]|nr:CoA pyrophosphatase [Gammaproteobacteria bacterium]